MVVRAVRSTILALALAALPASQAGAFTMAEQLATTGTAGTLARTSAPSASRTIGSVKSKLGASTPKLTSVRQPGAAGAGTGKGRSSTRSSSGTGWGDSTKGWSKSGGGGKNGKSWQGRSNAWPQAEGWGGKSSRSKAWVQHGGGSWMRPGKKKG
ncbi:MAG TPA: hypothetical protein VNO26_07680 [Candidatus Limnocylindria bacterium]|nr:hypothetical protein [Candidatus Limnocylindria bacterium]